MRCRQIGFGVQKDVWLWKVIRLAGSILIEVDDEVDGSYGGGLGGT